MIDERRRLTRQQRVDDCPPVAGHPRGFAKQRNEMPSDLSSRDLIYGGEFTLLRGAYEEDWTRSAGRRRDLCGYAGVDYRRPSRWATISSVARGCSAVGSASPCQGEGRGFESRHPLEGAVASTPAVEWPSGEATACKAVHTGSIPVSTSKVSRRG